MWRSVLALVLIRLVAASPPVLHWFDPPASAGLTSLAASQQGVTVVCVVPPSANWTLPTLVDAAEQAYAVNNRLVLAALGPSRSYVVMEAWTPAPSAAAAAAQVNPWALFGPRSGVACWSAPLQRVTTTAAGTQTSGVDTSLDRIDQRGRGSNGRYAYIGSGQGGVGIYIIDTGIYTAHQEFGSRATWLANYIDGEDSDCHGHGTHVSSLAGGTTYGTSKQVPLFAVKVLGCDGGGTDTSVALGIELMHSRCLCPSSSAERFIASMSLQGPQSSVIDDAITSLYAGCPTKSLVVAAAGNSGSTSCQNSPGGSPGVFTIAASDASNDFLASFSNRGDCVELAAPGVNVLGAATSSTTASVRLSGTSMSTPFASGICANAFEFLGPINGSRSNVIAFVTSRATKNSLRNSNLPLLYSLSDVSGEWHTVASTGINVILLIMLADTMNH